MSEFDDFKQLLAENGVIVHRDMEGPTDKIDGVLLSARSYDAANIQLIIEHIKNYNNVSFYNLVQKKGMIRYAVW